MVNKVSYNTEIRIVKSLQNLIVRVRNRKEMILFLVGEPEKDLWELPNKSVGKGGLVLAVSVKH